MVTYKLHLIRHGLTAGNREGRYVGRTDMPLCERGEEELCLLKSRFAYPKADMVVTSPLQRCVKTAEILYPDSFTEQWAEFIECDFGEFEGKKAEELFEIPSFAHWLSEGGSAAPQGGESGQQLTQRVVAGMKRLFERMMHDRLQSVALVTHGGVISTLVYGMGVPKMQVEQCMVGNGRGFTVLLTPQLWMRDRAFEVYGVLPYGLLPEQLCAELSFLEED